MLIDLSIRVTKAINSAASENERMVSFGHLGTHFDVMDKEFPLEFTKRDGVVFDVSGVARRDIDISDIDINSVDADMFVAFYTGYSEIEDYGTKRYFTEHPELSDRLIDSLLERKISIIGVDCAGIKCGSKHTPKDRYCADRGVFIIENLCGLGKVLNGKKSAKFKANTYPINFSDMSGLPCRVTAEVEDQ